MDYADDENLIWRAQAGDKEAMAVIYERYLDPIYHYIYRQIGNSHVAEDLCAEVFLRMVEGIGRYENRGWAISAWLYRIAHDRVVDRFRQQQRTAQVELVEESSIDDDPHYAVQARLDQEEMWQIVARLERGPQWVIRLRFLEQLSVREVAQRTGRSEGAIKALPYRALQNLARIFDKKQQQGPILIENSEKSKGGSH